MKVRNFEFGRERRRRRRAERWCGSAIAREPAPTRTAKMSLDFSETYKRTGPTPVFSPDGRFLATAVEYRLVIRDAETLTVCSISSCLDRIHKIEWAPNSDHVLCACYKRGVVQCFSVSDEKWTCLIDEGPAGCVHARWSPNGTHILTVAEFNVRCSVWSLLDKSCVYLRQPKFADRGIEFSPNGKFILVVERRECKDHVSVVSCSSWTTAARFQVATTDLADATWSPDGTAIAVWDAPTEHALHVYRPDGTKLASYEPSSGGAAAGVRVGAWCPRGGLLATGSLDQRARLFSHVSWRMLAELSHPDAVVFPTTVAVYREVEEVDGVLVDSPHPGVLLDDGGEDDDDDAENDAGAANDTALGVGGGRGESTWWEDVWDGHEEGFRAKHPAATGAGSSRAPERPERSRDPPPRPPQRAGRVTARYVVEPLPASVPTRRPRLTGRSAPAVGVGALAFSGDGRFLATKNDCQPTTVWVWSAISLELCACLQQLRPVTSFGWDPTAHRLAVATGDSRVYVWTPEGASFVEIPLPNFAAEEVAWSPAGGEFVLADRDTFCCSFFGQD